MDDEFKIRLATGDDIPVLLHQRRHMFQEMGCSEADLEMLMTTFTPYLPGALAEGSFRAGLAETVEGQVVAGAALVIYYRLGRRWAYICDVYTEPAYRRHGLARRLVETLIAWSRAEGLASIDLHASPEGRPLYVALGFQPTDEMRLELK